MIDNDFLKNVSIFVDLNEIDFKNISSYFTIKNFPKNSMIVLEEEYGDTVYIVNEGAIFFEGNPEKAIKNEKIKKFYLGSNFSI